MPYYKETKNIYQLYYTPNNLEVKFIFVLFGNFSQKNSKKLLNIHLDNM